MAASEGSFKLLAVGRSAMKAKEKIQGEKTVIRNKA